jgi:Raf kinase inhibitor-like YbhB/YbcL family protein
VYELACKAVKCQEGLLNGKLSGDSFDFTFLGTFSELCFLKPYIMATKSGEMKVYSPVFAHNGHIPPLYTCEGENINPPLEVSDVPAKAKTLAIIVEDPDAPHGVFDHWLVWNILPNEAIAERSSPGISGINGFGKIGYGGPCPPSGTHRYFFKVYALDAELDMMTGADKKELLQAMEGHVIAEAVLVGHYQKRKVVAG